MSRVRIVALALALLPAARAAGAQAAAAPSGGGSAYDAGVNACVASIPPERLARVVVYLEADVADSTQRGVLPIGDLLADLAAARVRRRLSGASDTLPRGDAVMSWRDTEHWLSVTLHRDGTFRWRPRGDSAATRPPVGGAAVLAQALTELEAEEQRLFWPDGLPGDSARFELHLHHPAVREDGTAAPLSLRLAVPLLTLPVPTTSPAAPYRATRPAPYPTGAQRGGAEGTVILRFVIDTAGRVEPESVREMWPATLPRLTGERAAFYDEFLQSTMRSVRRARYEPARIGGCPVRQLVQQAFAFKLAR